MNNLLFTCCSINSFCKHFPSTYSWTTQSSTNSQRSISSLQSGTTYQYRIRTNCPQGWTAWTAIQTFSTEDEAGGGSDCTEIQVSLTLDEYGSETSWEIVSDEGYVISSGGPYGDNQEGSIKNKTVCLTDGCYTLYLDDAYGDGICCDYGDGYLEVLYQGEFITGSDGYFGYTDEMDFCVSIDGFEKQEKRTSSKQVLNKPAKK